MTCVKMKGVKKGNMETKCKSVNTSQKPGPRKRSKQSSRYWGEGIELNHLKGKGVRREST